MNILQRIQAATNAHDLDALVACFAVDVESVQPAHPTRSFRGNDQVRQNWGRIFAAVPDLRAELIASSVAGDDVWSEWKWSGTRGDGAPFEMRGVTVQTVRGDTVTSVRFFMEPVDTSGANVSAAITQVTGR